MPANDPVSGIGLYGAMDWPVQSAVSLTCATVIVGNTTSLKEAASPVQLTPLLVNVGTTVMLAVTGTFGLLALAVVNEGRLPVPADARPIAVLSFVQVYTADGVDEKLIAGAVLLLQRILFGKDDNTGFGLTVISTGIEYTWHLPLATPRR